MYAVNIVLSKIGELMNKKRIIELEIIRAFAFMLVIVQHTIGGYSLSPKAPFSNAIILRFLYTIGKPAVPMFIFISGISLFYSYRYSINIKEYYKKRLLNIVLPYVICSFMYIIIFHRGTDNLLIKLIDGDTSFHLWYMGTAIRLYLIFPAILLLLNKLSKATKKINLIFISIFSVVSFILIENKNSVCYFMSTIFAHKSIFYIKEFASISPIYLLIYFVIGFYFISFYDKAIFYILKYKNIIIVLFSIFLIPSYLITMENRINFCFNDYFKTFLKLCFNIFSIFFWYYISLYISKKINKIVYVLRFISHYSFSGYLYHVMILDYIAKFFYSYYTLTDNYIFASVVLCLSTIIIVPIVCYLFGFIPYSKYIWGTTRYDGWTFLIKNKKQKNKYTSI